MDNKKVFITGKSNGYTYGSITNWDINEEDDVE